MAEPLTWVKGINGKKKGLWMGGPVPLGYEVHERKLVVDEQEAEEVRHIMRRYLALGSVPALVEELNREGHRTKVQRRSSGPHRGGCTFRRGTLYHLLSNRIYRGYIVHKGKAYPGEHEPIVDEGLWNDVQALLADNACGSSRRLKHEHPSLLTGKLVDGEGRPMSPSHATKSRRRYRYYVTRSDQLDGSRAWRVSAHDLEQLVCTTVADKLRDGQFLMQMAGESIDAEKLQNASAEADLMAVTLRCGGAYAKAELLKSLVRQVRLLEDRIEVEIDEVGVRRPLGVDDETAEVELPVMAIPAVRVRRGHQLRLVVPGPESRRPKPVRRDEKLIAIVAEAHHARQMVLSHPERPLAQIAREHGRCRTRLAKLVALSCLAPDIVTRIVEGKQPEHLTLARLTAKPLPLSWDEQRRELGLV
jgi:site-specific DNA recombinase